MIAQGALDGPAGDAGIFVAHLAAQLDERVEDSAGSVDSGEDLLFVHPEGEHLLAGLRIGLLDTGLAVFGPPDGQAGFLPEVDEASWISLQSS